MTRNLCCLVLICFVTACAPKGIEVPEAAVTPPKRNNNNSKPTVATTDAPQPEMPRVVNPEGMVVPDIVNRLPDRNDMTPTAPPAPTGGGVIATPPAPRKPVNE